MAKIVSILLLICLFPIFVIVALAIIIDSRLPIFFRQKRIGLNNSEFWIYKFRTMKKDTPDIPTHLVKEEQDYNTFIGPLLRKLSIDELPQLINVLKGEMTLVGPRPAVPGEVSEYTEYQSQRLMAVPGITCIWQVTGRSNIPFEQQVELDLQYIRKSSLLLDIKLLLLTIPAVLTARGAY